MNGAVFTSAAVAALIAAAGGGFIFGRAHHQVADISGKVAAVTPTAAQTSGEPIYYQDPDGKPFYSLTPMKTKGGRDYQGVPARADIRFEKGSPPDGATAAPTDRKVYKY